MTCLRKWPEYPATRRLDPAQPATRRMRARPDLIVMAPPVFDDDLWIFSAAPGHHARTAFDGGCLPVQPDFWLRNFSTHPEGHIKRLLALSLIAIAMIGTARALPGELSLWVDCANGDDLNDCTELHPSKEFQGAVSKITGMFAWISVAKWSGTYAAVDLSHHKTVTIEGDCNDPSQPKVAACRTDCPGLRRLGSTMLEHAVSDGAPACRR